MQRLDFRFSPALRLLGLRIGGLWFRGLGFRGLGLDLYCGTPWSWTLSFTARMLGVQFRRREVSVF